MEDVKEFLKQIRNVDLEVESLKEQLLQITTIAEGGSISYKERVQTSTTNKQEDIVVKVIDSKQKLENLICERLELIVHVNTILNKLDAGLAYILRERYCNGKDWLTIRRNYHCSEGKLYQLHNKALKEFKEILQEEETSKRKQVKGNKVKKSK